MKKIDKLIQAVESNPLNAHAYYELASYYEEHLKESNPNEIIQLYLKASNLGYSIATLRLADIYDRGDLEQNPDTTLATSFYKKAIDQYNQYGEAYYRYGLFLMAHPALEKIEEGLQNLEKASSLGYDEASYMISKFYKEGILIQKDLEKAESFARIAMNQNPINDHYTRYLMEILMEKGVSNDEFIEYISSLIASNAAIGYLYLGLFYLEGKNGVEINIDKSINLFNKGLNFASPNSLDYLELNYYKQMAYLVKSSSDFKEEEYIAFCEKINEAGSYANYYILGDAYLKGSYGLEKDYVKAEEYFLKDVTQEGMGMNNHKKESYASLGALYRQFDFKKKDPIRALEYYHRASELGLECSETIEDLVCIINSENKYLKRLIAATKDSNAKETYDYCLHYVQEAYPTTYKLMNPESIRSMAIGCCTFILYRAFNEEEIDYSSAFEPILNGFETEFKKLLVKYYAVYLHKINFDEAKARIDLLSDFVRERINKELEGKEYDLNLLNFTSYLFGIEKIDKNVEGVALSPSFAEYAKAVFDLDQPSTYFLDFARKVNEYKKKNKNAYALSGKLNRIRFEAATGTILFKEGLLEDLLKVVKYDVILELEQFYIEKMVLNYHTGDYKHDIDVLLSIIESNENVETYLYQDLVELIDLKNTYKNKKIIKILQDAADLRVVKAIELLAKIYEEGIYGCEPQFVQAIHYYELLAIQENYNVAYYKLGDLYRNPNFKGQDYEKSIAFYEKASDLGVADASNYLGRIYLNGFFGKKIDYELAADYFEKAISQDNACCNAYYNLAIFYKTEDNPKKNLEKSILYYENAAKIGSVEACNYLGRVYSEGLLEEKVQYELAIQFFTEAIALDPTYSPSYFNLGTLYRNDDYPGHNNQIALDYYEKASDAGNMDATFYLGKVYSNGLLERTIDFDRSNQYYDYIISQDEKNANAYYYLAINLRNDENPKKDYEKSMELDCKASNMGSSIASNDLGVVYTNGLYAQDVDTKKAQEYLEKAIEQDKKNATAYYNLAGLLLNSATEASETHLVINYFMKASDLGNVKASNYLGRIYHEGLLKQNVDYQKATSYFEKAIEQDKTYAIAYYNLAVLYEEDKNPDKDIRKAIKYYLTASRYGNAKASNYLGRMYAYGLLGTQIDNLKALEYYSKAIDQDSHLANAYYNLAHYYLKEDKTIKDEKKALENYIKASSLGEAKASNELGKIYLGGFLGQNVDLDKAVAFFKKALEQDENIVGVYYSLGYIYSNPDYVEKDNQKAVEYFIKASSLGDIKATKYLVKVYKDGLLDQDIDPVQATKYATLSYQQAK